MSADTDDTIDTGQRLKDYVNSLVPDEPAIFAELRARTREISDGAMILGPASAKALQLIVRMVGARRVLEVGTFTGCSSTSMALALPEDGQLTACDVSEEYTEIAREFWVKAGVDHKIELRIGPALDTLAQILAEGGAASYDMAFIDADKSNYQGYYDLCLELVRPGGVIAVDNVLWGGSVADPDNMKETTQIIRAFNEAVAADPRTESAILAVGDGLAVCWKR
ncbi:MAG: class I SAM-dependent methyltransferase [Alphaproteobacteria bacterium]|nr:class I SAM-dependent methyltransferase [Alphaproteobacteria bacterium]